MEKNRKIFIIVFLALFIGTIVFTIFNVIKNKRLLNNSDPNKEITVLFNKYLDEPIPQDGKPTSIKRVHFVDKENNIIPLDKFSASIGFTINPEMGKLLDNNNYSLFSCFINGEKGYGITLNTKAIPGKEDTYDDLTKAMRDWEPTILPNIKTVVFPYVTNIDFVSINSEITFKDGAFRYAIINMPDGSKKSINYLVTENSVTIADSRECVYATFPY